jgi:hypothetical protein
MFNEHSAMASVNSRDTNVNAELGRIVTNGIALF